MGGEFGQVNEWNYDWEMDWHLLQLCRHQQTKRFISDLNQFYTAEKALFEIDTEYAGFEWIDFLDRESSVISFIRRGSNKNNFIIAVFNFTPVPRYNYRIGTPAHTMYKEVFNSDSEFYGGGNIGNLGAVNSEKVPCHNRTFSVNITIPPLAGIILKPRNLKNSEVD